MMKERRVGILAALLILAIALSLAAPLTPRAGAQGLLRDSALVTALQQATPTTRLRVVATFDAPLSAVAQTTLAGLVARVQPLEHLPMALIEATPGQLALVERLPGLRSLYLDRQLRYSMREAVTVTGAARVWQELGYDGRGVTVAVVDSGIDTTHPDLPARTKVVANVKMVGHDIVSGFYVAAPAPNTDSSSGHGTHVAGSVAGLGTASNGLLRGAAPGAQLVGVGTGDAIFIFSSLAAFDWVLDNHQRYSIDIVTNSWGTTGEYDASDPVNVASKALNDAGLVVLFAAGNEGPGNDTLNPYSVAPWVIGVAAGNKDGRTLADFSSRGRPGDSRYHPTITAPGVDIVSTRAPNTLLPVLGAPSDIFLPVTAIPYYTTMSGTSMATPITAGIVALLLQADPTLTPAQIKQILVETATPMPGYATHQVGAGYVNAFAAVQAATR